MLRPPALDEIEASLAGVIPSESVEVVGAWLPAARRTYRSATQEGTGAGPFVEVIDLHWSGTMTSAGPIAAVAFVMTADTVYWSKSTPPAANLPADVSLHTYADHQPERATFTASVGGAILPGVPVSCGTDLARCCERGPSQILTGRVEQLARVDETAILVLVIPGRFLKTGRHRLWHLREEVASSLPNASRVLLTRGRSGEIHP